MPWESSPRKHLHIPKSFGFLLRLICFLPSDLPRSVTEECFTPLQWHWWSSAEVIWQDIFHHTSLFPVNSLYPRNESGMLTNKHEGPRKSDSQGFMLPEGKAHQLPSRVKSIKTSLGGEFSMSEWYWNSSLKSLRYTTEQAARRQATGTLYPPSSAFEP